MDMRSWGRRRGQRERGRERERERIDVGIVEGGDI